MTDAELKMSGTETVIALSSAEFAAEPESFVIQAAQRMGLAIDGATLRQLCERITRGASRAQVIRSLQNISGEKYPTDRASAALHFARFGNHGEALIVENILHFAPDESKAYVLHAFEQVLARHPTNVELARLTHQLDAGTITRINLLKILNDKAISEGRRVLWDTADVFDFSKEAGDSNDVGSLIEKSGSRTLSQRSHETLTLCKFVNGSWELAPAMVTRAEEIRRDSWVVSDGFILTGPRSHMGEGRWLLEVDIVQPDWAPLVIDVVANAGIDRLLHLTIQGNVRGAFRFEKLRTHAFPEVRLRVHDCLPEQWISIESIRLRKID